MSVLNFPLLFPEGDSNAHKNNLPTAIKQQKKNNNHTRFKP